MKVNLELEMGETTCASEPGKFCQMLRSRNFGTEFFCGLFEEKLFENGDGWLERCPKCVSQLKDKTKPETLILWNPSQCLIVIDTMTDGDYYSFIVVKQTWLENPSYLIIQAQEPLGEFDIQEVALWLRRVFSAFEIWYDEPIPTVQVEIWDGDGIGESNVLAQYLKEKGMEELVKNCSANKDRQTVIIDCTAEGKAKKA